MGQCISKRSTEISFGPPVTLQIPSKHPTGAPAISTENDSDDDKPDVSAVNPTALPNIEPERRRKKSTRSQPTATHNLQRTVIQEDSAIDAPSDEESIVRPPHASRYSQHKHHQKRNTVGRLSPVKLQQQRSTTASSIHIRDYPLQPDDTVSRSAMSNFQKLKLQVAVSEVQKQKSHKLQKVEKQLRDEQEYSNLWNEYEEIQNMVQDKTTDDNWPVRYEMQENNTVAAAAAAKKQSPSSAALTDRIATPIQKRNRNSSSNSIAGSVRSRWSARKERRAAGANDTDAPSTASRRNPMSSAASVGSWLGNLRKTSETESTEYAMEDVPSNSKGNPVTASNAGSVKSRGRRHGRHDHPAQPVNGLPRYDMEDDIAAQNSRLEHLSSAGSVNSWLSSTPKQKRSKKKAGSSGNSVRSLLSSARKKKKNKPAEEETKKPTSRRSHRSSTKGKKKNRRPIAQAFEYDLQDDFRLHPSTGSVRSRRSGNSYRSRNSAPTKSARKAKRDKHDSSAKQRGRSDSDSFDLKESNTWFFDFQDTFPDDDSVASDNSQAALSLLSESSMEAQRRLYAEKRRQRKKKNKPSSSSNSKSMNAHSASDAKENVQGTSIGYQSRSRLHSDGGSRTSSLATNDYGPVRRGTSTACSTPIADTNDNLNHSFTNLEVEFLTPPSDSNKSGGGFNDSFVSDIDDDTASYASLNDFNPPSQGPTVDMNQVLQRRLDIEQRLRELAALDEPDTVEPIKTTTLLAGGFLPAEEDDDDNIKETMPNVISPDDKGETGASLLKTLAGYLSPDKDGVCRDQMASKNLFGHEEEEKKTDVGTVGEDPEDMSASEQRKSGADESLVFDMAESAERLVAAKIAKSPNEPSSKVLLRTIETQKTTTVIVPEEQEEANESFESASQGFVMPYLQATPSLADPTTMSDYLLVNDSMDANESTDGAIRPGIQTTFQGTPIPFVSPDSSPREMTPMLPNDSMDYCDTCADDRVVKKLLSATRDTDVFDDARDTLLLADQVEADVQNVLERYRSGQ